MYEAPVERRDEGGPVRVEVDVEQAFSDAGSWGRASSAIAGETFELRARVCADLASLQAGWVAVEGNGFRMGAGGAVVESVEVAWADAVEARPLPNEPVGGAIRAVVTELVGVA